MLAFVLYQLIHTTVDPYNKTKKQTKIKRGTKIQTIKKRKKDINDIITLNL